MDIIDYIEEAEEELREYPDRIIIRAYIAYLLHDLPNIGKTSVEQRKILCDNIAACCLNLLCPPLAVNTLGNELCLLVHLNLGRTAEEIALASGQVWSEQIGRLEQWAGDYSAITISGNEVSGIADAVAAGDNRILALFDSVENGEQHI